MKTRVGMPVIPRRPNPRRVQPRPSRRGLTGWDRPPYWFATYLCRGLGHRPAHRTPRDQFRTCTRCHNPTEWMTPPMTENTEAVDARNTARLEPRKAAASPEHQAWLESVSPLLRHIPVEVRYLPPQVEPITLRRYIDDPVIHELDHVVRTHGNEALVDQWEYHRPEDWPNGAGRSCVGCYDDWRFTGLAQALWPCPAIEAALLVAGIEIPEALR